MRVIRASEIGSFIYCQRAWWYQKKGVPSQNLSELASGTELHYRHGRAVLFSGCLRALALVLLISALVVMTAYLTRLIF